MTNELIIELPKTNALQVFVDEKGIDPFLDKIRKEAMSHVPDIATKKGREQIASIAMKVAKCKTYLDDAGKQLCDQERAKIDATLSAVLASRKRIKQELDDLRDEVRKPLTDWENAESERKSKIESRIAAMKRLPEIGSNSEVIEKHLKRLQATEIDDSFCEYTAEAALTRTHAIRECQSKLDAQIKIEKDLQELKEFKKKEAERLQKEKEDQIAKAAVEKAMAEIVEKKEPEVTEKDLEYQRQQQKIRDEELPGNKVLQQNKTKSHIEDHILKDFENFGISTGDSKLILEAIKKGFIRHVYIRYE